MTTPARFYAMPDGTSSHIQMTAGPDGTPRPVAVSTPEQLKEWDAIQAAAPPSASQAAAQMMARLAGPLFKKDAGADDVTGASLLDGARFAAEAEAATVERKEPRSAAEQDQRTAAAAQLAAVLDLEMVLVGDDPALGVPPHLELRQSGNCYAAGDLVSLETLLEVMARERAKRDAQIQLWRDNRARIERERQEQIYNLPENRLARLEARLADLGIEV